MQKKRLLILIGILWQSLSYAQYAPPAGMPGSTAIYKDSSVFVSWASACSLLLGYQTIVDPAQGKAAVGDSTMAVGMADIGVVSLGDGGMATLTFHKPITDREGWDFAVFENAFDERFLELAFVEVSSDGEHFYRFNAVSNTQDTTQIGPFDYLEPTELNNLAGKYKGGYGTPFDLSELKNELGLNIQRITHVRIIDVVGSLNNAYAQHDFRGHKVNDPWPTAFPSSGFDLDAVGVIHQAIDLDVMSLKIYPNPTQNELILTCNLDVASPVSVSIKTLEGNVLNEMLFNETTIGINKLKIYVSDLSAGLYLLTITTPKYTITQKLFKQ